MRNMHGWLAAALALVCSGAGAQNGREEASAGRTVFEKSCASCHLNPSGTRAPPIESLHKLSASTIRAALTTGAMQAQGAAMSAADRETLIAYLAAPPVDAGAWIPSMKCSGKRAEVDLSGEATVASIGIDSQSRRRLSAQATGLKTRDFSRLQVKWALAFPNVTALRSQPVVVGSTLFIAIGQNSRVFALDTASGCVKWVYESGSPLRTSLTYGTLGERKVLLIGGEDARLHVIDAKTGERVWVRDVRVFDRSRTTAAPLLLQDRIIIALSNAEAGRATDDKFECCRTHGAVVALSAESGERLWVAHTMDGAILQGVNAAGVPRWGPSGAPIWSSPTYDAKRGVVYVGTGENFSLPWTKTSDAIMAIDVATGAVRWSFQGTPRDAWNSSCGTDHSGANCPPPEESIREDWDFGGSVVIAQRADGSDILLAGQKSGHVWALDPDANGKLVWSRRIGFGTTLGGVHWGLAVDDHRVFVPINDSVRPNRFSQAPVPGIYALDVDTGEPRWSFVAQPDCAGPRQKAVPQCANVYGLSSPPLIVDSAVVAPSVDGRLRIFDAATGAVIFTDDTVRGFRTLNGIEGHGGQIDSATTVAADGALFVQSGYGALPGNVLIAYRPK